MSAYSEEEGARDRVVQAAMDLVDRWELPETVPGNVTEAAEDFKAGIKLLQAVHDLRSLHADRGLRDPGTPGEQEAGPDAGQRQGDPEGHQP